MDPGLEEAALVQAGHTHRLSGGRDIDSIDELTGALVGSRVVKGDESGRERADQEMEPRAWGYEKGERR